MAWEGLRRIFPEALAAVLMPNHLHVIAPKDTRAVQRLGGLLGVVSRRLSIPELWQTIPPPTLSLTLTTSNAK